MIGVGVLQAILSLKDDFSPKLSKLRSQVAAVAKAVGAAVVAGFAAASAAIVKATADALAFADTLDNQAKATQAGANALQVYNAAAERAGQGPAAITTAIQRMQRAIGEGSAETDRAITNLGLSVGQLKALKPEEQFELIFKRLGDIPNEADRAANAMILLGRSGANLLALSGEAIPDLRDQMRELGLVIDKDAVAAVDRLEEDLDLLTRVAEGTWRQLGVGVASSSELRAVVLLATDALGQLNKSMGESEDGITGWVDRAIALAIDNLRVFILVGNEVIGMSMKVGAVFEAMKTSPAEALLNRTNPFAGLSDQFDDIDAQTKGAAQLIQAKFIEAKEKAKELAAEIAGGSGAGGGGSGGITGALDELQEKLISTTSTQQFFFDDFLEKTNTMSGSLQAAIETTSRSFDGLRLVLPGTRKALDSFGKPIEDATNRAEELTDEFIDFSGVIRDLDSLFAVFGVNANSTLGSLLSSSVLLVSQFEQLGKEFKSGGFSKVGGSLARGKEGLGDTAAGIAGGIAGIANATSSGSTGARTGKGLLAGAGAGAQLGGPIGAIVGAAAGAITGFLRGRSAAKALDAIENEVGHRVSEGMLDAIRESGRPAQLMIADIFAEGIQAGTASVNDLAREMGDVFSFLERGDISESEAIRTLEQSTQLLLQNLKDLGPAGEAEIQRIIAAADRLGVEFEGLGDLINSQFAPQTLEQMAETLNLTTQEARELAKTLGVDVQTNLERAAAAAGLSVKDFKALQEAAGAALGQESAASMEQLQALMESTGLTAQQLADKLGIDVKAGADGVDGALANSNTALESGIGLASVFANELERARDAANAINVGEFPQVPSGIPMARGGFGEVSRPTPFIAGDDGREGFAFFPGGLPKGGGGGGGGGRDGGDVERLATKMDRMADYMGGGGLSRDIARAVRDEVAKGGRR